jgi:hypothetical protein
MERNMAAKKLNEEKARARVIEKRMEKYIMEK